MVPSKFITERHGLDSAAHQREVPLEQAPRGYSEFDTGAATKFVLDPNEMIGNP
ncbi:hypothetical protein GCWB2_11240 [Gordonia rubripertincta]|nr:hypothetical protein GCWB2_11240 [Gordonia rubripertincta]